MSRNRASHLFDALELRRIGPDDTAAVARLHFAELHWSFNGQLGLSHIQSLYEALAGNANYFGYMVSHQGVPIGFATATTDWRAMRKDIRKAYRGKTLALISACLRDPRTAVGILESVVLSPLIFRWHGARSEWLTFVTDTRSGFLAPLAALKLVDAIRDHFASEGIDVYAAQGVKNNPRAMQLYEKLGWSVVARLFVHNIYKYRSTDPDAIGAPIRKK